MLANPLTAAIASIWLNRDRLRLVCFYALVHGGLFLAPQSIYWDDWVLWNMDPALVADMFRQAGAPYIFSTLVHNTLLAAGPWLYKVLTFSLWLASGLLLHRIIGRTGRLDGHSTGLVILLYLTIPLFAGRIALIVFPYTLYWSLFVLAWWMTGKSRWAALLLFAMSFNVQSMLVFYAVPMLEWLARDRISWSARALARWGMTHIDFLLLPFAWFAVKTLYFKPHGFYAGYNEGFALWNLVTAASRQAADFGSLNVGIGMLVLAAAVAGLLWHLFPPRPAGHSGSKSNPGLLAAAALMLLLAVLPYWIVGKTPTFAEWGSRHQLLMPLGASMLITAVILMLPARAQSGAALAVVALFMAMSWQGHVSLYRDWQKQQALVSFLERSNEVAAADLVIFHDGAPNAFDRKIRFYEYNGMLKLVFGTEKKFGVSAADYDSYAGGKLDAYFVAAYNAAEHRRGASESIAEVTIAQKGRSFVFSAAKR